MKWDPATITHFLREVPAPAEAIPVLCAISLAATGGRDDYEHRAGVPGAGHQQGLFAIDTDRYPILEGRDLYDPHVAARMAWHLSNAFQTFGWAPTFRSGRCAAWLAVARAASAGRPFAEVEHHPVPSLHATTLRK